MDNNNGIIAIETKYGRFNGFAGTRIGGRAENQDTVGYTDTPMGLLVLVCDGMGGGPGGKTASVIAVKTIGDFMAAIKTAKDPEVALRQAINAADAAIVAYAAANKGFRGMGSTVTALLINDECAYAAHVGDSRIFQLRGGKVVYRSTDHSKVMDLVRAKIITEEQARTSDESNIITQALGHGGEKDPEIVRLPYLRGDRFALCTDGIWGVFPQSEVVHLFTSAKNPAGAVDNTVITVDNAGVQNGNRHDNLTVAIIDTTENSKLPVPMNKTAKILIGALAAICLTSLAGNLVQCAAGAKDTPDPAMMHTIDSLRHANDSLGTVNAAAQTANQDLEKRLEALEAVSDKNAAAAASAAEKAEKAEAEAKKAQEQAKQANQQAGSLAQRLAQIEKTVAGINKTDDVKQKTKLRNRAVREIDSLIAECKDNEAKKLLENAKTELNKKQALKTGEKGKSQIGAISRMLKDAAKKIK